MIRIEYDDDILEVIDKINKELKKFHIVLQDDKQEHDGFILLDVEVED